VENCLISSVLRDSYGGLWISSLNKGVLYYPNRSIVLQTFPVEISKQGIKKYAKKRALEVIVDGYNNVFLKKNGDYELVKTFRTNVEDVIVKNGNIYIQSHGAAMTVNNDNSFIKKEEKERENKFLGYIEIEGTSEFVSCGNEYVIFSNQETKKIKGAKRLICIKQQGDTIWLGGMNGLFAISVREQRQIEFNKDTLLFNRINYLELLNGYLLVATRGDGLLVYKENELFQIKEKDGLVNNSLSKIVKDADNNIWISSNTGISKIKFHSFNPLKYEIVNWGKEDGLLSKKVNDIQLFEDTLYVLSSAQVYTFSKDYVPPFYAPSLYISKFQANNKTFDVESEIELDYNQNNIEIFYEGLFYPNPEGLTYYYSMDVGKTWLQTTNRSISFFGLPSGEYSLSLKTITTKGQESKTKTIDFSIKVPFWTTWWFYSLIGSVFLLLVYEYVRRKINQAQKDSKLQAELYTLENKALSSQMNPHFIFNALTAIQHFIIKKDKYEAYNYLTQFAQLVRAILKNSENGFICLKEELELLGNYLDLEQVRFENKFDYSINIDTNIDINALTFPSMLIQPYAENAIRHGFMHKEGKGNLDISLELDGDVLVCVIQDNGIGRKKSKSLNKDSKHQSFAMNINERRLELLNQLYKRNLSLKVEDLYDGKQPLGTKVTLYIPIEHD